MAHVDYKFGKSADGRLTNAWHGTNAGVKAKALDLAVQFAEVAR